MPSTVQLAAALIPLAGVLLAAYKYVHEPKAPAARVQSLERRLKAVEDDMQALKQTLHGGQSEVDDGILVKLQQKAGENEQQLKAIRRELREIAHQIEEQNGDTGDIKYRGGNQNDTNE